MSRIGSYPKPNLYWNSIKSLFRSKDYRRLEAEFIEMSLRYSELKKEHETLLYGINIIDGKIEINVDATAILVSHKLESDYFNMCLMGSSTEEGAEVKGLLSMCDNIYSKANNIRTGQTTTILYNQKSE